MYWGEGGGTGGNGFYYSTSSDAYSYWYFGSLRGTYRAKFFYVGHDAIGRDSTRSDGCGLLNRHCSPRNPTANSRYEIQQQNEQGEWEVVYRFNNNLRDSNGALKEGWRWRGGVELDGNIRVKVYKRYDNNWSRLAVDSFRLEWRDLLPIDKFTAITACKVDVFDEVVLKIKAIKGVAQVVLEFAKDVAIDAAIAAAVTALGGPAAIAYTVIRTTSKIKQVRFVARAGEKALDLIDAYRALARSLNANVPTIIREAIDTGQDIKDLIESGTDLGLELVEAILNDNFDEEDRERYHRYVKACEEPNGVDIWDDLWEIVTKDGYLDYVQNWHPNPNNADMDAVEEVLSEALLEDTGAGEGEADAPTPAPVRTVSLRQTNVDAVHDGKCRYSCTWQAVSVSGFSLGLHRVRCWTHNHASGLDEYQTSETRYVFLGNNGIGINARVCYNGLYSDVAQYSADVYVTVGGYHSNTITLVRP